MNDSQWQHVKTNCKAGLVPGSEIVAAMVEEIERLRADNAQFTQRIAALEAAARALVEAVEMLPPAQSVSFARDDIKPQLDAVIKALGRLISEGTE